MAKRIRWWSGTVKDQPDAVHAMLDPLSKAGVSLDAVVIKRTGDQGDQLSLLMPIQGESAEKSATEAGLRPATEIASLRVEGQDRPGIAVELTHRIAAAGLRIRALVATAVVDRFVAHIVFDSEEDANKAADAVVATAPGAPAPPPAA